MDVIGYSPQRRTTKWDVPVIGYSPQKNTELVRLPVETVVAAGIHPMPLKLDVFDPNPVEITEGNLERQLSFPRIDKVAFGITDSEFRSAQVILIEKDLCLEISGPIRYQSPERRHLKVGGAVSITPEQTRVLSGDQLREKLNDWFKFDLADSPRAFPMTYASLITRLYGQLFYNTPHWPSNTLRVPIFAGTMCEAERKQVRLPEHITWAFDAFKDWQPVVSGEAIKNVVAGIGRPSRWVRVLVKADSIEPICHRVKALIGRHSGEDTVNMYPMWNGFPVQPYKLKATKLHHNGVGYEVVVSSWLKQTLQPVWPDVFETQGGLGTDPDWPDSHYSDHQYVAVSPGEVRASRIASLDLQHGESRNLALYDPWKA
jgi:hypothetical protein